MTAVSFCVCGDHAFLPLRFGYSTMVDVCDAELLASRPWSAARKIKGSRIYVAVKAWVGGKTTGLHRLILPEAALVDHLNGNPLDNRRRNLRSVTRAQNAQNRRGRNGRTKGIHFSQNRWRAAIRINDVPIYLGSFVRQEDAQEAYNRAALEAWGEYASYQIRGERN